MIDVTWRRAELVMWSATAIWHVRERSTLYVAFCVDRFHWRSVTFGEVDEYQSMKTNKNIRKLWPAQAPKSVLMITFLRDTWAPCRANQEECGARVLRELGRHMLVTTKSQEVTVHMTRKICMIAWWVRCCFRSCPTGTQWITVVLVQYRHK